MILNLYSVYDEKTEVFFPPIYCHTDGQAIRHFKVQFANPETLYNQFPSDYKIYRVGKFNDNDGALNGLQIPELIISGMDLVKKESLKPDEK